VKRERAGIIARVRVMVKKKPTVKIRRTWTIKPVQQVVESRKSYSRKQQKQQLRKETLET